MAQVRVSRFAVPFVGLGMLAALTGCGERGKADVTGTIKLRGQAPKFAGLQVVFLHAGGAQVAAPVNKDGSFKAEGVPAGEVKVCFAYIPPAVSQQGAEFQANRGRKPLPSDAGVKSKAPPVVSAAPTPNPLPQSLRDTSTSKLTLTVASGKPSVFDYDITP
jgi:hypothetical protein